MSVILHIEDLAVFLVVLLGPVPLCFLLFLVGERGREKLGLSHCMLVFLTGWCVIETCIGLFLGTIHCLTPGAVLLAECLILITGILLFLYTSRQTPSFSLRNRFQLSRPLSRLEQLMLAAISVVGIALLWRLATQPITEYDSLGYHLPVMANWYQKQSFAMLEEFYYPEFPSTYPYNWEVLCTLFLMPFGEDFLVALPNLIAWVLLGISTHSISREMGATRTKSLGASALVLTLPIVMRHVNEMHADLPFAALFMAGLYWTLSFSRTRSLFHIALFLATLGMFLGVKTSGILYGIVLFATLVLLAVGAAKSPDKISKLAPHSNRQNILLGACAIVCFLFLGGFWYVRNLIQVGNPLGYVQVRLAGITLFPGPVTAGDFHKTTLAYLFHFTNPSHWNVLATQALVHLNLGFVALIVQALFLPVVLFCRGKKAKPLHLILLTVLLVSTAFLYWTTPYSADNGSFGGQITPWLGGQMRFAFPFIAWFGAVAAIAATYTKTRDEIIAAVVAVLAVFSLGKVNAFLAAVVILSCWALFAILSSAEKADKTARIFRPSVLALLSCILAVLLVAGTLVAREQRDTRRNEVYGGIAEYIHKNVGQDEIIGYILSKRSYLFYGKELNRRVKYVPPISDSLADWTKDLHDKGVSVIAIGPLNGMWQSSKELMWLTGESGPFVRVFGVNWDTDPMLFRFREGPAAPGRR